MRLCGRPQYRQRGRQDGDRGDECDKHSRTGDLAELGKTSKGRRQEREEAGSCPGRRQCQGNSGLFRGIAQSKPQIVDIVPFRPVSDAELQPEVDAEPDEQHRKGDRNQIERANRQQTERSCRGKAHDQSKNDGKDDSQRSQRKPQYDQNRKNRCRNIDERVLAQDRELFVVDRNLSGQSYRGVEVGSELEVRGRLSDGGGRSLARFQRGEIQDRLDFDEAAQLLRRCRSALHEDAPGEARRSSGEHVIQGVRAERQRPREVIELELSLSRARDRK